MSEVIGDLVPRTPPRPNFAEWPDFEARLKAIYGDRIIPAVADLPEDRENSRY